MSEKLNHKYSETEERLNVWSHGLGLVLSIVAFPFLIFKAISSSFVQKACLKETWFHGTFQVFNQSQSDIVASESLSENLKDKFSYIMKVYVCRYFDVKRNHSIIFDNHH